MAANAGLFQQITDRNNCSRLRSCTTFHLALLRTFVFDQCCGTNLQSVSVSPSSNTFETSRGMTSDGIWCLQSTRGQPLEADMTMTLVTQAPLTDLSRKLCAPRQQSMQLGQEHCCDEHHHSDCNSVARRQRQVDQSVTPWLWGKHRQELKTQKRLQQEWKLDAVDMGICEPSPINTSFAMLVIGY